MAEQNLNIKLTMNKDAANAASKQFFADQRQRQQRAFTDAEVLERAMTRVVRRENDQRIAEIARQHKTSVELARATQKMMADAARKTAKDAADAAKAAAREQAMAQRQAAKAASDAARKAAKDASDAAKVAAKEQSSLQKQMAKQARDAAREQAKAARDAAAEARRTARETERFLAGLRRDELRQAKQAAREKAAADNAEFRSWKALHMFQHKLAMQDWTEQQKKASDMRDAVLDAAKSTVSFGLGMAGLNSLTAVMSTIADNWQRINQSVLDGTGILQDYRESLLELAALKGHIGETGKELVNNLQFRAQTGQTQQNSIALQSAAIGVGEGAIDKGGVVKKISSDEFDKAMVSAGKMQAVEGGDATTYGRMVGLLPGLMPGRQDAVSVGKELAAMYELAKPGGFSFSSGMSQFGKGAAYAKAGILSPREIMAIESSYSVEEPESAGERLDQLVRATVGSLHRNRKVKGLDGSNHIGTAAYLKGLGAKDGMKPQEIAMLVQADLAAQRAKVGEDFNPYGYLQSKGYGNQEELKGLINFDTTRWRQTYAPMLADKNLGSETMNRIEGRLASDPAFVTRRSQTAEELGKMAPGIGKEGITAYYRTAYGRLKQKGGEFAGAGDFDYIMSSGGWNPDELIHGYKGQLRAEVSNMLEAEAVRLKIDPRRPMRAVGGGGVGSAGVGATFLKGSYSDEQAASLYDEIVSKGGGGLQDQIQKMVAGQTQLIRVAEEGNQIARERTKSAIPNQGRTRP